MQKLLVRNVIANKELHQEFARALEACGCIRTESGPVRCQDWQDRLVKSMDHNGRAVDLSDHLYICEGCRALCDVSFGGADDERCDDCWAAADAAGEEHGWDAVTRKERNQ